VTQSENPRRPRWQRPFDPEELRPDREDLYLRLHSVTVFVRDQDRSLRFFRDQLGFSLVVDVTFEHKERWIAIAPPDGTAVLALVAPKGDQERLVGSPSSAVFVSENVVAQYEEWKSRGVKFQRPPEVPPWGGVFTVFEDPDGNTFALVGRDEFLHELEAQRRSFAEKLEAERRAAREMEIAMEVQARLFPKRQPTLRTLDYAGVCIQARQVGGDYYDFLDLGSGRVNFVVADISGKGIGAALLMANLQANLRSQSAITLEPQRLLCTVNRLFGENTIAAPDQWAPSAYATLFFAEYDDASRRLRYANCGHLAALLLRTNGDLERLAPTGTVLGLFKEWDCTVAESCLHSGDVLLLYSDGITETFDDADQEFGEERLIAALRRHRELPALDLLAAVVDEVRAFSTREQHDDITAIVAKGKDP
jgi:serine phosphatase RsbU (regulator of sigma subunit)/predicted enzyme related to lactoylglutathione lyase